MVGGEKAPVKRLDADLRRARAGGRLRARRPVGRGPLREDDPQRDRVRPDAGLRRGLRAPVPLGVRPRPERDRRHLALRLGRPLVAARAPARRVRAARRPARRHRAATSRTRARAAGRSTRRSTRTCPLPAISAALFARFASRQEIDFSAKVHAALRNQFGGHAVRAVEEAKAAPGSRGEHAAENPLLEGLQARAAARSRARSSSSARRATSRSRKLFPALYSLAVRRLLPERFGIVGVARTEQTTRQWVDRDEGGGQGARARPVRRGRSGRR